MPISIIVAVVSIVFLLFAPWQLALPVVLMLGALVRMKVIAIRRIAALEVDPTKRRPARGATAQVALEAEEKVLGTMVGIMTPGWQGGFGCYIKNPQNAMIITTRHVVLLFVPLPGGDVMVDGADLRYGYFMFGKKKLEEKLSEMLSSMSLEEIINSDADNIVLSRDDLQPVQPPGSFGPFKSAALTLITKDGQKYSYYFRDQSDLAKAVQLLRA